MSILSNIVLLLLKRTIMSILDNYRHIAVIGQGHFASVKKYACKITGQQVAIKMLKNEHLDNKDYKHRFAREVELLGQLNEHPHIIDILDSELSDSLYAYIMPLATTHLHEYLKPRGDLSLHQRLLFFDQVLDAVKYLHKNSIVHRDISPRNVLLFNSGSGSMSVVLSDFGLGKELSEDIAYTRSSIAYYGVPPKRWTANR